VERPGEAVKNVRADRTYPDIAGHVLDQIGFDTRLGRLRVTGT
jgi:hypothetical protein